MQKIIKKLRVIIVSMPGTWQKLLLNNLEVHPAVGSVAVANGSLSAMQLAEEYNPDMVLIDSSIPTEEALAFIKNIKRFNQQTKCIVLTDTTRQGRRITLAGADHTLPSYNFTSKIGDILNSYQVYHDTTNNTGMMIS